MMHPLVPFVHQRRQAPYTADWISPQLRVFPVIPETALGKSRTGPLTHHVTAAAAVFIDGQLQYGARWRCGYGSHAALLLDDAPAERLCGFCRHSLQPCVYRLYDADGGLIYVGSTVHREQRMARHSSISPWWPEVAEARFEDFPSLSEARAAERVAIRSEYPARNRAWVKQTA